MRRIRRQFDSTNPIMRADLDNMLNTCYDDAKIFNNGAACVGAVVFVHSLNQSFLLYISATDEQRLKAEDKYKPREFELARIGILRSVSPASSIPPPQLPLVPDMKSAWVILYCEY